MQDLLTSLGSLFTFLINQLGNIATFFTTNTIGQIILGLTIFGVVVNLIVVIISKLRG